MSLARLRILKSQVTSRTLVQGFKDIQLRHSFKTKSDEPAVKKEEDDEDDKPIQYSTSPAAHWSAGDSQRGGKDNIPWYQPPIVMTSMAIFLIYFIGLREPNDIDEIFDMELGDHFPDSKLAEFAKKIEKSGMPVQSKN